MLKDFVSIDVQGFFDKEMGIVFQKDPSLNNSYTRYS